MENNNLEFVEDIKKEDVVEVIQNQSSPSMFVIATGIALGVATTLGVQVLSKKLKELKEAKNKVVELETVEDINDSEDEE